MQINQVKSYAAMDFISKNPNSSLLIDVRCEEEFNFVGICDLSNDSGHYLPLPWRIYPTMDLNSQFTIELENYLEENFGELQKIKGNINLFFICRSGARSNEAAHHFAGLGYENCHNVSDGFEGDLDNCQKRSNISGWKFNKLPWKQT